MGSSESKLENQDVSTTSFENTGLSSAPVQTPIKNVLNNVDLLDPRSPSVARTPLEILQMEHLHDSKLNVTPMNSYELLEIDPRSPTVEFIRTPILVEVEGKNGGGTLKNKNLLKVLQSEFKILSSPRLIESKISPLKQQPTPINKRASVGLLETNIDFTETDLDEVIQTKLPLETAAEVVEDILETSEEVVVDSEKLSHQEEESVVPKLASISLEEDSIPKLSPSFQEDSSISKSAPVSPQNPSENETLSSKSAPITPPTVNCAIVPPIIDLTADVDALDKKLTKLIYEDHDVIICPKIVQLKDVDIKDRSPLKNLNGQIDNKIKSKSAHKLKVSNKPRKSNGNYPVSKIPVFKERRSNGSTLQCENTPPRVPRAVNKKSLWDNKDVTLYL